MDVIVKQMCYTGLAETVWVSGSCFAFNLRYNLVTALIPPDRLSNDTDTELAQYRFKAVDMKLSSSRLKILQLLGEKLCIKCEEIKPLDAFGSDKSRPDGKTVYCKACHVEKSSAWQKEHRDKQNEVQRRWLKNNREKHLEYNREYNKKWISANRAKANAMRAAWKLLHLDQVNAWHQNRRAKIKGNGGKITAQEWQALTKKYNYTCLCCKRREPEIKLVRDHVLPLDKGGKNTIDNIQPLCVSCNCKKHTKHIDYRPLWRE
jgi:5-methylcytosine-specific restriction endonuclease McrA